jgi:hypothetical protein
MRVKGVYMAKRGFTDMQELGMADIPLPDEETPIDKILGSHAKPLYSGKGNLEDMGLENVAFYQETTEKAFASIMNEENERLAELVNAKYNPLKPTEDMDDFSLMKAHLNIAR